MNYKILQKSGKDIFNEIMELKDFGLSLNIGKESQHKDNWRTLEISGELPGLSVYSGEVLTPDHKMFEHVLGAGGYSVICDRACDSSYWISPSTNNRFIFGRTQQNKNPELYYTFIKPHCPDEGTVVIEKSSIANEFYDYRIGNHSALQQNMTGIHVSNRMAGIQAYFKNEGDNLLSLTNLGITPLKVRIEQHEL